MNDSEVKAHLARFITSLPEADRVRVMREGPSRAEAKRFQRYLKQAAEQAEAEAVYTTWGSGGHADDDDGIDGWPDCWV